MAGDPIDDAEGDTGSDEAPNTAAREESPDLARAEEALKSKLQAATPRSAEAIRAEEECSGGSYLACWSRGLQGRHPGLGGPGVAGADSDLGAEYFRRAIELAEPRCDEGNVDACRTLSRAYGEGYGVDRDMAKSREYLDKAVKLRKFVPSLGPKAPPAAE